MAFVDDETARKTLNGIVHPLVAHRRSEMIAAAADDAVIVEDIPLLVESGMAPMFPLVVIVHARRGDTRRAADQVPGHARADARARIAAQATEEQRRAVADVLAGQFGQRRASSSARPVTCGRADAAASRTTWTADNRARSAPVLVPYDPAWPDQARRIVGRLNMACGHRLCASTTSDRRPFLGWTPRT